MLRNLKPRLEWKTSHNSIKNKLTSSFLTVQSGAMTGSRLCVERHKEAVKIFSSASTSSISCGSEGSSVLVVSVASSWVSAGISCSGACSFGVCFDDSKLVSQLMEPLVSSSETQKETKNV